MSSFIDPTHFPITPGAVAASQHKNHERRIAMLERRAGTRIPSGGYGYREPSLENGFANFGGGYATVAYNMDARGHVDMEGKVAIPNNGTRPLTIFTLPTDFRPLGRHEWAVRDYYAGTMQEMIISVGPSGAVQLDVGGVFGSGVSLDAVEFRALLSD